MEPPEDRAADGPAQPDGPGVSASPRPPATGPGDSVPRELPAELPAAEVRQVAPGTAGEPADEADPEAEELGGISALSLPSRLVVALAVAAVAVGAVFHIGMVFLHVAPSNTLSQQHSRAISDYVYPEFEQNWKLFAPNPVQENNDVQARAEVRRPDGGLTTTGWVDLTAMDIAEIRHDPIPSHTVQNELRRAWSFYLDTHDGQGRAVGLRGNLSQRYILRIVAHRFGPRLNGGAVQRVQVRGATTPVASPPWSTQKTDTRTNYHALPWWAVSAEDFT